MKLRDSMIRSVVTASPEASVSEVARKMREQSVGCVVISIDGNVKGIMTDRDLLGCIVEAHDPSVCKVSVHMSRPVIVLRSDEDLDVAAHIMRDKRIKRLPIIEAGKIAGLISLSDIARITHAEAERQLPALHLIAELIKDQALYQNPPPRNTKPAA